jgi:hypothetical protein
MGKVWFVTGASRGIGAEIASMVVQAGLDWLQPLAGKTALQVFHKAKTCFASVWTSPSKNRPALQPSKQYSSLVGLTFS